MYKRKAAIIFVIVVLFVSAGCDDDFFNCNNAFDLPPGQMLAQNDYVFIGTVEAVNTIAYLGELDDYDSSVPYYLMEYQLRPLQTAKAPVDDSVIFLWQVNTSLKEGNYWRTGIAVTGVSFELISGNAINSPEDIIGVMLPEITDSLHVFNEVVAGARDTAELKTSSIDNLPLVTSLVENESLRERLAELQTRGSVIHGTEFVHHTMRSFSLVSIRFCDSTVINNVARMMTWDEYWRELLKLAGKTEPPIEFPRKIWVTPANYGN